MKIMIDTSVRSPAIDTSYTADFTQSPKSVSPQLVTPFHQARHPRKRSWLATTCRPKRLRRPGNTHRFPTTLHFNPVRILTPANLDLKSTLGMGGGGWLVTQDCFIQQLMAHNMIKVTLLFNKTGEARYNPPLPSRY